MISSKKRKLEKSVNTQKERINAKKDREYISQLISFIELLKPYDIHYTPNREHESIEILVTGFYKHFQVEILVQMASPEGSYKISFWIDNNQAEEHIIESDFGIELYNKLKLFSCPELTLTKFGTTEIMNSMWKAASIKKKE